jgi:hypothetical protein
MTATQYISFFDGNKEKAIRQLEKSIALYENASLSQRPKTVKRFEEYNTLLTEIKAKND